MVWLREEVDEAEKMKERAVAMVVLPEEVGPASARRRGGGWEGLELVIVASPEI